ncbi:MAG: site-specific integrase, partial [Verrucomicrobia bacterium]|nr:site-specific integrase [Verrucomicrobiota bacterium]
YIPMLEENNVQKGFFEHDEFLRLRDALPPEIRPVLTFAYYTGCRKGEILALHWDQVDLDQRAIRLEPGTTKNDEPRVIPLTTDLLAVLRKQQKLRDRECPQSPLVFFRDREQILDFRGAWEEACKSVGMVDADEKPTKLFHDLRRTGVRNLVRAGVPEIVAMAISGHKTRSVFDRYNIVSEADLQQAAEKLDAYLAAKNSEGKSAKVSRSRKPRTL